MLSFFLIKKRCDFNFTIKDLYECFFELLILDADIHMKEFLFNVIILL